MADVFGVQSSSISAYVKVITKYIQLYIHSILLVTLLLMLVCGIGWNILHICTLLFNNFRIYLLILEVTIKKNYHHQPIRNWTVYKDYISLWFYIIIIKYSQNSALDVLILIQIKPFIWLIITLKMHIVLHRYLIFIKILKFYQIIIFVVIYIPVIVIAYNKVISSIIDI